MAAARRSATFALATAALGAAEITTSWSCVLLPGTLPLHAGVSWSTYTCSSPSVPVLGPANPGITAPAGPVRVNIVTADLGAPGVALTPATPTGAQLAPLDQIANKDGRPLVACINGGYFFRVDVNTFIDGVCEGKSKADAESPPSASAPNDGLADGTIVVNGALRGSNCDCAGFSRPTVLTINGTSSRVDCLHRGAAAPFGLAYESLSAGPFLVQTNASGSFTAIPADDDNIGNILEHAANTGVGLAANGTAYLATFDGYDGCSPLNSTCGTNDWTLAYFFKDYLKVSTAMAMDQGGSTTMWVKGSPPANGVVSSSGGGVRNIFGALCVEAA